MTGVSRVVCNMCLFLFVLHRAEGDMVSTVAYFLARHEGILTKRQLYSALTAVMCLVGARGNLHDAVVW